MPRLGAENRRIPVAVFGNAAHLVALARSEEFILIQLKANASNADDVAQARKVPVWVLTSPAAEGCIDWPKLPDGWAEYLKVVCTVGSAHLSTTELSLLGSVGVAVLGNRHCNQEFLDELWRFLDNPYAGDWHYLLNGPVYYATLAEGSAS